VSALGGGQRFETVLGYLVHFDTHIEPHPIHVDELKRFVGITQRASQRTDDVFRVRYLSGQVVILPDIGMRGKAKPVPASNANPRSLSD